MPNNEESRPRTTAGGQHDLSTHHDVTPTGLPDIAAVRAWAVEIFENACEVPVFGSPAWCALDDADPLRVVSAIRAGVAWAAETAALPDRLAAEIRAADLDLVQRVRGAGLDVASGTTWAEQSRQISQRRAWLRTAPWAKRRGTLGEGR